MRFPNLLILTLIATSVAGCASTQGVVKPRHLEIADFNTFDLSTTMTQVHDHVGRPSRIEGSGIYIEVYELADGSEVLIGWSGPKDRPMVYLRHDEKLILPKGSS